MTAVIELLSNENNSLRVLIEKSEDPFGHTKCFDFTRCVADRNVFLSCIEPEIEIFQPDLVHITDDFESLRLIRQISSNILIVFSIHSMSVLNSGLNQNDLTLANKVVVSTPDILAMIDKRIKAEWYDRPSPCWFKYTGGRQDSTALMVYASYFPKDQRELAKKWCKERNIELTILNREEKIIPFEKMPEYYSQFEYVLDFKGYENHPDSLSKVAKEAALCGCKIVHDSDINRIIQPDELPRVTEEKYIRLYKQLIKSHSSSL